jgi:hypothetical protein
MKRTLTAMVIFLGVLCGAATSQAYSYAFDITGGAAQLSVNGQSGELSLATTEDLIVGFTYDAPSEDMLLSYTLSADLNLNIPFLVNYELTLDAEPLGVAQSIDPTDFIGDGTNPMRLIGETQISGDFGDYYLEDASLAYDIQFTPDSGVAEQYALTIDVLTLTGGNTQDFLAGIFSDITGSGELPDSLSVPIQLSGSAELTADPVPIPAAAWLLGSGLIGILGLRRRSVG